ncbi:PH and sec7 domain-containing protein [Plakobranchus ocellatus]|uniref:PH and sec7 domain-containing protein n=1 Tax=Plakobranchus ocellatus TaxID=259542 RepID=A0AAV3YLE5_9GAST|nr:PH and sec7 domain-containing protein [Plakobranchus ocellatus]
MASKTSQSPSRLPLPLRSNPTKTSSICSAGSIDAKLQHTAVPQGNENGALTAQTQAERDCSDNNYEAHCLRDDMVICTAQTVKQKIVQSSRDQQDNIPKSEKIDRQQGSVSVRSPKNSSKIARLVKNQTPSPKLAAHREDHPMATATSSQISDFPFVQAPVAEIEELSDLSQSSCSESDFNNGPQTSTSSLPSSQQPHDLSDAPTSFSDAPSMLEEAVENLSKVQTLLPESSSTGACDTFFSEPPSSGDSGFVHDGHVSDPELPDKALTANVSDQILFREGGYTSDEALAEKKAMCDSSLSKDSAGDYPRHSMVTSRSGEKFGVNGSSGDRNLVRTSKSHENYLQAGTGIAFVNIDIDDNLAYSLDTLTYHDSPDSSSDNVASEPVQMSRSLDNSPDKRAEKLNGDREFPPGVLNLEDSKVETVQLQYENGKDVDYNVGAMLQTNNSGNSCLGMSNSSDFSYNQSKDDAVDISAVDSRLSGHVWDAPSGDSLNLSVLSDESDADSLYHQPSKGVDRPSAVRLAKRLFHLEGFRKSDVSRHLSKKNDFSNLVAEEYLKFFDFEDDTLDSALRKFLHQFSLYGESQERERVLGHFSHRFMECNPDSFNSEDACHYLTCAIMLLNSDLHTPDVSRRMTCQKFIENLAELNDGDNFPKEVLKAIYQAIKNEPIEWAVDQVSPDKEAVPLAEQGQLSQAQLTQAIGSNPFLEVPDPSKTTEYKRGYVMRKSCMEPDRRKTPFGKRSWKMLYAVLRDMIMYQYKDEHQLKKGQFVENAHNAIRIHHALATKAADYTKKQHVFRLQTADWAEYLFQTGDSKELREWVDSINMVAASLSAPPLPGAVGSQAKFQRQLLPSTYTRFNLKEQLQSHRIKVQELEQELHSHRAAAPEKGAKSSVCQDYIDKEVYLEFELKRFKVYVYLLNSKLSQFPDALEPSLLETAIGENEEFSPPSVSRPLSGAPATVDLTQIEVSMPDNGKGGSLKEEQHQHQPSLSDRYSYRAAIYQSDSVQYDMLS